ncbi:MAG: agmatinase family protein [Lewinellaceae bacterium]|nr:agmatinase family protein [Saprospiraceae bacterium]MCB9340888.1 agmatinase family protein [Lewinellaceae bacterium]
MTKQDKIANFDPSGPGLKNGHFIGLPFDEEDASIVLLSVPWDVTVSYSDGTSTGPQNILETSTQLDLFDADVPDAWKMGIYMRHLDLFWLNRNQELRPVADSIIEFLENGGNPKHDIKAAAAIAEINNSCLLLKTWVYEETKQLLEKGKLVGIVGGEHSVPLGFLEALAKKHGSFGILQIDAHQDLRNAYEGFTYSHASIFYNALQIKEVSQLIQVGIRDFCEEETQLVKASNGRVKVWYDQQMREEMFDGKTYKALCKRIVADLPDKVYISFDIDGLNPNLCPNTGTPVPGGLEFNEAVYLIKTVVESGREIIGFDLCEVAGLENEWDGNVGARVLYKLCNLMGKSSGKQ